MIFVSTYHTINVHHSHIFFFVFTIYTNTYTQTLTKTLERKKPIRQISFFRNKIKITTLNNWGGENFFFFNCDENIKFTFITCFTKLKKKKKFFFEEMETIKTLV